MITSVAVLQCLVFVLFVLVAIPVALFVIQNRQAFFQRNQSWPLVQKAPVPGRYSVESDESGYSITFLDPKFFDYVADNIGIFKPQGVIDPESYHGGASYRHTVAHIKFILVQTVYQSLVFIPGEKNFAAMGNYTVTGDTLMLNVYLNPNEHVALAAGQHSKEDTFLRTALQVMEYGHGMSKDPRETVTVLGNVQQSIKDYLYPGLVPWPIHITYSPI